MVTRASQTRTPAKPRVQLPQATTVGQLAELLGQSPISLIKHLMKAGVMATVNQVVDYDTARRLAQEFGFTVVVPKQPEKSAVAAATARRAAVAVAEEPAAALKPRPPVVTIMGHVDHGKTSLLDAIRRSKITATEAGEITQHIGAYQVNVDNHPITFIDTPGHEAFTAMRARGAQITDVAILVVAADDGVMPQTVEALDHIKAAQVPLIVAMNKIDKPGADLDRIKRQLGELGLVLEEWGGEVLSVPVSAKTQQGIPQLLESILLVAELGDLKANPDRLAQGVVLEASLDKSRGPVGTVLIQAGTLRVGDPIVAGEASGKVKAMFNDLGKPMRRASPSSPVLVMGLNGLPQAGDLFASATSDKVARTLAEGRAQKRAQAQAAGAVTLDRLAAQIRSGEVKELNLILKTDVQGSIEPIRNSLVRLEAEDVKLRLLHAASGTVTESDVMLAVASKAIVVGFNTRPEPGARRLAEAEGVDIRLYDVIYHLVEDVEKAMKGLVEPVTAEVVEGHAQVRAVFDSSRLGRVAGCYVTDGKVIRGARVRVVRRGQVVGDSNVVSLRHVKEDVREIGTGAECGVGVEGYNDFQVGDVIEVYRRQRAPQA
ncbi:MAG: translation initiation factor IF-2 [Chloroflexi bacterium]|nr:translation initiation factor IF-2 [Chloroflexota bacterium]